MTKLLALGSLLFLYACAAETEPQDPTPAPSTTETPGSPTEAPAAATTPAKADCTVPYFVGQDGRKHYKMQCLQGG